MKNISEERIEIDDSEFQKRLKSNLQNLFVSLTRFDECLESSSLLTYPCKYKTSMNVNSFSSSSVNSFSSSSVNSSAFISLGTKSQRCLDRLSNDETAPWQTSCYPSSSSSEKEFEKTVLVRSISSSSEEDMNVNSPDSGFESSTPTGRISALDFPDDTLDDVKKPASASNPLCLVRLDPTPEPPKPVQIKEEPLVACKWKNCTSLFTSNLTLQEHITSEHVETRKKRFSCLWLGCRVFDMPTRNISCLRQHVLSHIGKKRFKCVLDGCDATFTSRQGVARHVPSHFNDSNIPKARVSQNDRRLVKRRRVKDKRKALANTHDCIDAHSIELMKSFLVRQEESWREKIFSKPDEKILCKRSRADGTRWGLNQSHVWSKIEDDNFSSTEGLFFSRPAKRRRKFKETSEC